PRSRRHRSRYQQGYDGAAADAETGQRNSSSWPDTEYERLVSESWHRAAIRRRLRLSADGRELPDVRRSFRRDPGPAGDALRHRHNAVHHRHHVERAVADGRDHGGRRCFGELDFARDLRTRATIKGALRI